MDNCQNSDYALLLLCTIIFFWSGKLVPGLVKIVSLPDRMSCKVWRTFVKTAERNFMKHILNMYRYNDLMHVKFCLAGFRIHEL